MAIIKEYYSNQIDMRGPGAENAKPVETGTVCILRCDDGGPLTVRDLGKLFNEAANDFPGLTPKKIQIKNDHIEFSAKPPADYTKLKPKTIGARG
ncbi:MAG: hypothetical protein ACAH80_17270 [Alphaproteobacteria bacterium]